MWKPQNKDEFIEIVGDLLQDEKVLSMRELPQHSKASNCLDHSIYVAYLSFLVCRRLGLDYIAAARAGLLHDFYLCKWEEENVGIERLWTHPKIALKNAEERYDLTKLEKDIIVKHMWPLTPRLPRYRESFVVSMVDKVCAISEMTQVYRALRVKKNLSPSESI